MLTIRKKLRAVHRILLALIFTLVPLCATAQSWEQIKASPDYLFGEGTGTTVAEADEKALADLISKISIQVESSFEQTDEETAKGGDVDAQKLVRMKVNTYSQATLTGTERMLISNEPDAIVGRYIKRTEVQRIFEGRKLKVNEFVRLAQNAQADLRIDDALRYYYWAYALTRSLPRPNDLKVEDNDGQTHVAMAWLPEQMNRIFAALQVTATSKPDEEGNVNLRVCYNTSPVGSLDYSYFDGQGWSPLYSARDGQGVLELVPGATPSNVQIKYEYAYKGQAVIDKEIQSVLAVVPSTALRKSYVMVPLNRTATAPAPVATSQWQAEVDKNVSASVAQHNEAEEHNAQNDTPTLVASASTAPTPKEAEIERASKATAPTNTDSYRKAMKSVVKAIATRNYAGVKPLFTPEGYAMFNSLINYGRARLLNPNPQIDYFKLRDEVVARSVPMAFSFAHGVRKKFVEDVTFTFNKDGLIDAVAFAVGQRTWSDVMSRTKWPIPSRMTIIEFLENYKTAYALKRWDYLNSIFDDNALIIVGSVVHRMQRVPGDGIRYQDMPVVRSNRLSKQQYMQNLQKCFRSNEFVNIRFSDTNVQKGRPDVDDYGIQLKQDYYSSSYGDTGYLFLRVDINNPNEPIIRVRTWQPQITRMEDLIDLNSF